MRRNLLYTEPPGVSPGVLRVLSDQEGGEARQEVSRLPLQACSADHPLLLLLLLRKPSLSPDQLRAPPRLPQTPHQTGELEGGPGGGSPE